MAQFFHSGPGLACLHRLVFALHLVCVEVGACGMRLVCLPLNLTGLDRFVAASYGGQQQVNRQVEQALVEYQHPATARLATDMPHKTITVTQDETFPGGRCLVATEPGSNFIIVAQLAQARAQDAWHELMAPALGQLNCEGIQSTSDEAPGRLAYVAHHRGAHHSPDVFHVQHERSRAVCAPLAAKERAADKALTEAREQREQAQARLESGRRSASKARTRAPPEGAHES